MKKCHKNKNYYKKSLLYQVEISKVSIFFTFNAIECTFNAVERKFNADGCTFNGIERKLNLTISENRLHHDGIRTAHIVFSVFACRLAKVSLFLHFKTKSAPTNLQLHET